MNFGSNDLFDLGSVIRSGSAGMFNIVLKIIGNGSFNGNEQGGGV